MRTRSRRGRSAVTPPGTEARPRARATLGLEALPLPARDAVVRLLPPADALHALPFVSEGTLAAIKELQLPIGSSRPATIEEAVRQANARRRAWDLGTVSFSWREVRDESSLTGYTDVSALADCTDVSALTGGCAALHTLDLSCCMELTDVSVAGCAKLHTLYLEGCVWITDVSALAGCAMLDSLDLGKTRITEVSWASCATLRILDLEDCGVVDLSPLAGCANLHTLNLSMCWVLSPRADIPQASRGDAAAGTWTRGYSADESRRRRGWNVDALVFHRRVAATPRLERRHSVETNNAAAGTRQFGRDRVRLRR